MTLGTTLSRRDLFTALVGAPLALPACRREPARVSGSIRGPSLAAGHRLQRPAELAQASLERASGPIVHTGTLIAGAGPSGLCAAWRLERLGIHDFLLLDLEPRPGGTSAFGDDGVVPYPWGAHYVPVPSAANRGLIALLSEIGALGERGGVLEPSETALVRAPEERVFADGRWQEGLVPESRLTAEHRRELLRFEREVAAIAAQRDALGRPPFALPLARSSSDAAFTELDKSSAAEWLDRHGFRSSVVRWYVEYACRDDYGTSLERTSAWAMLFYFASRAEQSGQSAPFLTWPEGNGRLVRHLARLAGERLLLGHLVTDVVPGEHGVELAALDLASHTLRRFSARHAILALPKLVSARVLRPFREQPPAFVQAFETSPWLVANLHLSGRPRGRGFPFAWDNVLYDSPSLGYVVATHQTLSDLGPTIWTYYRPFAELEPALARRALLELDHESAATAVLTDLGRAHPDLEARLERLDVFRWGHAMAAPLPGFIWGADRRRAAEPLGRVRFAHSDLSGIALLEEAQYWGVRAAEDVARAEGRSFEPL